MKRKLFTLILSIFIGVSFSNKIHAKTVPNNCIVDLSELIKIGMVKEDFNNQNFKERLQSFLNIETKVKARIVSLSDELLKSEKLRQEKDPRWFAKFRTKDANPVTLNLKRNILNEQEKLIVLNTIKAVLNQMEGVEKSLNDKDMPEVFTQYRWLLATLDESFGSAPANPHENLLQIAEALTQFKSDLSSFQEDSKVGSNFKDKFNQAYEKAKEDYAKSKLQIKKYWRGSIAGVYNPITKEVEWKEAWHSGIAGVFNPATQQVEWKQVLHGGVAGVFNPAKQQVEWKEAWRTGVAGVYNPIIKEVEWKEAWHSGIAGVLNPATQQVEWEESFHGGVAGVFNPLTQTVEWKKEWHGGVAGLFSPLLGKVIWTTEWRHGVAIVDPISGETSVGPYRDDFISSDYKY